MDDPRQRKPDITLAQKELDWKPTIPLDEGLDKTIAYFEKFVKHPDILKSSAYFFMQNRENSINVLS
jgi:dTDP-D-glucose 4,6-dehydratase